MMAGYTHAMPPAFETGVPHSGTELSHTLGALLAAGSTSLAALPDAQFFAPQGSAWSPAEHVRHLTQSSAPLAQGLRLPRWLLRLRFGGGPGRSRTFTELRDHYLASLAAGGRAGGKFVPSPEPLPAAPGERRREIMTEWTRITVELQNAIGRWPESALDGLALPHPLLGPLTVREMLAFTVFHTSHHLRRIAERAAA